MSDFHCYNTFILIDISANIFPFKIKILYDWVLGVCLSDTSRRRWRAAETSTRPLGLTNFKKTKGNRMRRSPLTRLANRRNFSSIFKIFVLCLERKLLFLWQGMCTLFSAFPLSARTTPIFNFCFMNVCLFIFDVLSFPLMKYSSKIFSRYFSPFLRILNFYNLFPVL